jgi:hypothetical protein
MTVNALNSSGATVGDPRTLTNIPIAQNRLTTVIGHYFLPNAHLSIIVSDPFEDETEVDYAGKTIDDYININHKTQYSTVHDAMPRPFRVIRFLCLSVPFRFRRKRPFLQILC